MAELKGTIVLSPVVPPNTEAVFPTHQAEYGKGGHRSVATLVDRDAITAERREVGMLCYVQETDKVYQLKNGVANVNWIEFATAASGGGGGTGSGDMVKSVYDTNNNGIVDKAETANSVEWANVQNKPTAFSVVAHTHDAVDVNTDPLHMFVTSAQIAAWDLKQTQLGFTPENVAKKNIANGYAGLGADGKIPVSLLPDASSQQVFIVADVIARDAITTMDIGDIAYDRNLGDSYIWDGSAWLTMVDKDWSGVNIDWSAVTGKPVSTVTQIDQAVADMHAHTNKAILDATTESFTTALKNAIGNANTLKGLTFDDSNKTNGFVITYNGTGYVLAPIPPSGTGDMTKATYDTNNNGIVDRAEVADSVIWGNVSGKPTTFSPAVHKNTHAIGGTDQLTPADIGAATANDLTTHMNNQSNPHNVTKTQIGLANVDNVKQIPYAEKGIANGVAPLGTDGKVPTSYLPAIAGSGNATYSASSESEMLALTAVNGDKVIRTDINKTFILTGTDPAVLANWTEDASAAPVQSVNSKTGNVSLSTTDVPEGVNLYYTDTRVAANSTVAGHISASNNPHNVTKFQVGLGNVTNDAQVRRNELGVANGVALLGADGKLLPTQLPAINAGVSSVNTKTGDVVLSTSDIAEGANLYYSDSRVDTRINANSTISSLSTHATATNNPHSVTKAQVGLANVTNDAQVKRSEMGIVNGVATLDATGKIPSSQLPALAVSDTFVIASEAAMLALTANTGDIAVRTDVSKTFILKAEPASVLANWQEMLSPTGAASGVQSINGFTGTVNLKTDNIAEGSTNLYYTDARVAANSTVSGHIGNTSNPHNTTKSQVGLGNVDNVQQIPMTQRGVANGVATLGADGKVPASQLPASTGGGGANLVRYQTASGKGFVLATGSGVDVTVAGNAATITCPAGVQVISAVVKFAGTDIGSATSCTVNFGSGGGTGDNSTYELMYNPNVQVYQDVSGGRTFKNTVGINFNANPSTVQITALTANMAIAVKLAF